MITPEEQKPKIWNMPSDKTDLYSTYISLFASTKFNLMSLLTSQPYRYLNE